MERLLLDANFLVAPFQMNIDLEGEFDRILDDYELYTLNRTYNEALNLEDGKYRGLVKKLVSTLDIEVMERSSEKDVDDLVVALASDFIVCTNDRGIRESLRRENMPCIYIRGGSHLEAENLARL